MKTILSIIACIMLTVSVQAQTKKVITSGTIEFEKRINMYASTKKYLGDKVSAQTQQFFDQWKASAPQFATLKSTLVFNNETSLFTPIQPTTPIKNLVGNPLAKQFNTVYTDMRTGSNIMSKEIYGDLFLVKDSVRKITWRLTDETQDVAGYTCRRANGLILDSVYVVAFYTDKIWMSSGPESFSGLPGMILKVALPYENVIWTATKVTTDEVPITTIVPPKKGDVITNKLLHEKLKVAMKNWGAQGPYEMKVYLL